MSTVKQSTPAITLDSELIGEVCIANISLAERRKRLVGGAIILAVTLAILVALMTSGADRLWRLPLFLLFFGATSSYFQWRDQTCVGLANLNARKIGDKMEKIEDADELAQVKRQARRVQIKSLLSAVPLTLIALILPVLG